MAKETIKGSKERKTPVRLSRRSKLFTTIISALEDKKAENIISIDLKKIPEAVSDFFIICTVDSYVQSRAVANHVEQKVKENCGEKPFGISGDYKEGWVILDYINITVHIFEQEQRDVFNLEELWSDGNLEQHM